MTQQVVSRSLVGFVKSSNAVATKTPRLWTGVRQLGGCGVGDYARELSGEKLTARSAGYFCNELDKLDGCCKECGSVQLLKAIRIGGNQNDEQTLLREKKTASYQLSWCLAQPIRSGRRALTPGNMVASRHTKSCRSRKATVGQSLLLRHGRACEVGLK
jgi:hypothetical protein